MKTKTIYEAEDGVTFDTAEECQAHEAQKAEAILWGLVDTDTAAALNGDNPTLGDAFERFGRRCAEARIARGGSKRKRAETAVAGEKAA